MRDKYFAVKEKSELRTKSNPPNRSISASVLYSKNSTKRVEIILDQAEANVRSSSPLNLADDNYVSNDMRKHRKMPSWAHSFDFGQNNSYFDQKFNRDQQQQYERNKVVINWLSKRRQEVAHQEPGDIA